MLADDIFERSVEAIQETVECLASAVTAPSLINVNGNLYYRYADANTEQALVLKSVRLLSALFSLRTLIDRGLHLDAATMMRVLDETGSDILFLAGPKIWQTAPEIIHEQFLTEFFQEEFDHQDPLKSSQKRSRVSRKKIRAYVARTYSADGDTSTAVNVFATIEAAFSGYVHGAAVHTMDVYNGKRFQVPMDHHAPPLEALRQQRNYYCCRAISNVAIAAKALGDEHRFRFLYKLDKELFNEYGEDQPPNHE